MSDPTDIADARVNRVVEDPADYLTSDELELIGQGGRLSPVQRLFHTAPIGWWQFVPCATCNSPRQVPCQRGGNSWPARSRQPHVARVRSGYVLHGTLWLLLNGFESDVLGGL